MKTLTMLMTMDDLAPGSRRFLEAVNAHDPDDEFLRLLCDMIRTGEMESTVIEGRFGDHPDDFEHQAGPHIHFYANASPKAPLN